jgi:hypothetical protein
MSWNVDQAVAHLRAHAISHADVMNHKAKTGHCAMRTREAIEAGGLILMRHASAKDYGLSLRAAGFAEAPTRLGPYKKGDVVIIQPVAGHPDGHMAMFDGHTWISDFVQIDIWPGGAYRKNPPAFTVYRHQ